MNLFSAAQAGDVEAIAKALRAEKNLEIRNLNGRTPLMVAIESNLATVEAIEFLLEKGADPNALTIEPKPLELNEETLAILKESDIEFPEPSEMTAPAVSALSIAVQNSSYEKIEALINAGADVRFVNTSGYGIYLLASYGVCNRSLDENKKLFRLLKKSDTQFAAETEYEETVVSVLSNQGQFELLKLALELGAAPEPLQWTPLFCAVAFEGKSDVERLLSEDRSLEIRDAWDRTPFLVAIVAGKIDLAKFLVEQGSDIRAKGRCGKTALMYSIEGNRPKICKWLIELGCDIKETDEFEYCPLQIAMDNDAVECARLLIENGADAFQVSKHGFNLMHDVQSPEMFELLSSLGVNSAELGSEVRRMLCGEKNERDTLVTTNQQFLDHRERTYPENNPQQMNNPFWDEMVRTRISAYHANEAFGCSSLDLESPTWCYSRYGQSFTRLSDGRWIEIGGEHEDHYDPDFCIFNDVVVHHGNGKFDIFGYPKNVFPPTDFHSATCFDDYILIIGSLGYPEDRRTNDTPVYVLNCQTWSIKKIETKGQNPGWISRHTAIRVGQKVKIQEGFIATETDYVENENEWMFDFNSGHWAKLS